MNVPSVFPWWSATRLFALAAALLLVLAPGCGSDATPTADPPPGASTKSDDRGSNLGEADVAELVSIPLPDLSVIDPVVRQQIHRSDASLAALRQQSGANPEELATAYGDLGMLYHTYQLFDAAEACYRNAHRLAPNVFRWAYCLGMVYDSRNEPDRAIAPLETAVRLQSNSVPALVNLAESHRSTGETERAESLFQRALEVDSSCAVALFGLGGIAAERQDFSEAIRRFEAALAAQPGASAIHYPLAMAYRRSGDLDQAKLHVAQRGDVPAQIDDPLMSELRQLRTGARFYEKHAVAAGKAGRLETAVEDLQRALEAEPESPSAHLNLGTALALLEDKDAAMGHYRQALRLKPTFARAHYNLAVLLAERESVEEAAEHFRQAIATDPKYFDAHLALADLLANGGRHEAAVLHYARAIEIDPRHRMARLRHAQSLMRAGRYAAARVSLEEARQVLPESMVLAHALARLLATCPDASQRDGLRAMALASAVFQVRKSVEHAETVAMAYAETGQYEKAKLWQNRAIEFATDSSPANHLPRLRQNLTRYENGQPVRASSLSGESER